MTLGLFLYDKRRFYFTPHYQWSGQQVNDFKIKGYHHLTELRNENEDRTKPQSQVDRPASPFFVAYSLLDNYVNSKDNGRTIPRRFDDATNIS